MNVACVQPKIGSRAPRSQRYSLIVKRITGKSVVVRAGEEPEVVKEYREGDSNFTVPNEPQGEKNANPNSQYIDELPEPPRRELSPEMKARLKQEYYGLGGSPNRPMGGNYFLYIIVGVTFLAVASWLTGAI